MRSGRGGSLSLYESSESGLGSTSTRNSLHPGGSATRSVPLTVRGTSPKDSKRLRSGVVPFILNHWKVILQVSVRCSTSACVAAAAVMSTAGALLSAAHT